MKRRIRLGGYVVSLMLGALALGCGGDDKQARSPAGEPFESNVAEPRSTYSSSEAGAQSGMSGTTGQSGTTGATGTGTPSDTGTTDTGATGAPSGMGDTGTTGMSGATSTSGTGQDLCSVIERDATIKVMDIQGGIRLILTPRDASNVSSLRDSLRRIETTGARGSQSGTTGGHTGSHGGSSGAQAGSPSGGSSAGSTCALEGLSQLGAQVKVTEQAKTLRVDITSTSDVTRLRQHVRTMPQAGSQGSSGSKQGGSGSQGSQGGSQGSQGNQSDQPGKTKP